MSFVKYQNTNNASSLLIADITASQTTILITDGDQSLFPSSFPFLLTLEHLDANENVILREIVKAVSGNQNSFTVERSAGICVQDDTATNRVQDNTAHAFYSGDRISLYWTAEQVADIQNNLELKGNQDAIANVYDNTATYAVGDIVVYKGDRYVCQTAVSTAEDFDSSKWTKVNIQYNLDEQQNQIDNIEEQISTLGGIMKVDVLVLGGGGGGGGGSLTSPSMSTGGGGGAGELKIIEGLSLARKDIQVAIGSGGAGGAYGATQAGRGTNGGNSRFGIIVSLGGGGGGGAMNGFNASIVKGGDGGNGGGMGGNACCANSTCLSGMVGQALGNGNPGGWGTIIGPTNPMTNGGGGGGVGGPGGIPSFTPNGVSSLYWCQYSESIGGKGIATCFGGTLRCLGGGGGSGGNRIDILAQCGSILYDLCFINSIYNGKFYGGGTGGCTNSWNGKAGTANTGGGGGAGFSCRSTANGGAGGSGLVIVRYPKDCSYGIACATGGTITTPTINGIQYVVHTFTSSGTFCITQTA